MSDTDLQASSATYIYAGFWRRVPAFALDLFLITIAMMALDYIYILTVGLPLNVAFTSQAAGSTVSAHYKPTGFGIAIGIIIGILYFSAFESSERKATLGKRAMGLVVIDEQGSRISFMHAIGRSCCKVISWGLFGLGFFMAGWTNRKQALHDLLTHCLVMKRLETPIRPDMTLATQDR
ncbi:RDD family protein [Microvirga rosea]|uniref:RDD family protein n=1 Tax=Microvirga rosea TaxID=2715425 RepID=UPI001D0B1CB2|nr:RDD family protein [Microvirga rosea]MCB8819985.1 RDD family protein [Microvirga rosea]